MKSKALHTLELEANDAGADTKKLHDVVDDIIRTRSAWLHRATSDLPQYDVKFIRGVIDQLDNLLLDTLAKLPDNRPEFLRHPTQDGKIFVLQSIIGGTARYVTREKFDASQVRIEPTDRRVELENQRTQSREVLATIRALEKAEIDAVTADENDERDALNIVVLNSVLGIA